MELAGLFVSVSLSPVFLAVFVFPFIDMATKDTRHTMQRVAFLVFTVLPSSQSKREVRKHSLHSHNIHIETSFINVVFFVSVCIYIL